MQTLTRIESRDLDFAALSKGMYLEPEELERAVVCKRDQVEKYRLRVLSLCSEIEAKRGILCRMEGERLRLMTDTEALRWNAKNAAHHIAGVHRAADRTQVIDSTMLSSADQDQHHTWTRAICSVSHAMRQEQAKHSRIMGILEALPQQR